MRVLVIEDEADLASVLQRLLQDAGCSADIAEDGEVGLAMALDEAYDLVILDLMLPEIPGDRVLAELRSRSRHVPVLVLTARDYVGDRVKLLDTGADDYVVKPFEPAELVSRCRALMRRATGHSASALSVGDIDIDTARRTVSRGGHEVAITPREFRVIEYLALHRGRVVSRDELMTHLYSDADDTWSNVLDVYVASLRRKLRPDVIQTRRGHGFIVET
jgi:two-component system OmpR family response regulator